MAKYAQDWIYKYDPKTKCKYWYYKSYFVPLLESVDADDNISYVDLSVISGLSIHSLKSVFEEYYADLY